MAINQYKMAIKYKPNYAEAFYNLKVINKSKGNIPLSIYYLDKSLEYNPNYLETYLIKDI